MRAGKLHFVRKFLYNIAADSPLFAITKCGIEDTVFRIDFTNDVSTMESLPTTKTCKNCLRIMKKKGKK